MSSANPTARAHPGYAPQQDLLIAGRRVAGQERMPIINPANEATLGTLAVASRAHLDEALDAAARAFEAWRATPAQARAAILIKAAQLLRERATTIGTALTLEQGKPLAQSVLEVMLSAETFEWYAAEALRAYGRILPPRVPGARQMVLPEPVGPVLALTPWNFPVLLSARKIAPALGAGCTCILKPAEETPAGALALGEALMDAGLPVGVLGIVFGNPADISSHLIASPVIAKITFTGSIPVGKVLARQAAEHVKPLTLELGGHAPVIVAADADIAAAAAISAIGKTRNAGQVCTSPTRFLVQNAVREQFVAAFAKELEKLPVGDGLDPQTQIGPLVHSRRVLAMAELVGDAVKRGARLATGGKRVGNNGHFFAPTLLSDVPDDAMAMTTEPFGPIALVSGFDDLDEAIAKANRPQVGLAGYAFTTSHATAVTLAERMQVGMLGINSFAVSHTEAPFGGVKESGYGYEGGAEGFGAFLHQKYVNHMQ